MTSININTELFRALSEIAEDETLMTKVVNYVKKLTAQKKADSTLMTKEEFFANVDEALEQAQKGQVHRMEPDESLDDFLKRVG